MSYRILVFRDLESAPASYDELSLEKCRVIAKDCIDKCYGFQIEEYSNKVISIYKPLFLEKKSDGK